MDIAVHAGVKMLVFRNIFDKFRIQDDLVKDGVVGIEAQFFLRTCEYGGSGNFGAGAGQGGHGRMKNSRILDQIPALVERG